MFSSRKPRPWFVVILKPHKIDVVLRVRLRDLNAEQVSAGEVSADLISAETSFRVEQAGFGWGFSYTRPIRVESERGVIPIRDHVMIVKLAALAAALLLAIRRFGS